MSQARQEAISRKSLEHDPVRRLFDRDQSPIRPHLSRMVFNSNNPRPGPLKLNNDIDYQQINDQYDFSKVQKLNHNTSSWKDPLNGDSINNSRLNCMAA